MVTLCIPTYNRTDLLFECFKDVLNDERISEIVIVDDHSEMECFNTVAEYCSHIPKVKLYRNEKNLDCYRNKREAVSKATNEWVILFDSDNIITKKYVDVIYHHKTQWPWDKQMILQPSFAMPHFNFESLVGVYSSGNISNWMHLDPFKTMLNAMNYFVNRDEYLRVWDSSVDPVTSDSLYQNYRWIAAGNCIQVCSHLRYEHRVHSGSHYQNNHRRTPRGFHESIIQKLKEMK